jgi:NTE family protein
VKVDVVFEGGGVLGVGLVGALEVVEERGYEPNYVAGASAGAIVAALCSAGYCAAEIRQVIHDTDFSTFMDLSGIGRIPAFGLAFNALARFGLYDGDELLLLVRRLLREKGVETFKQLRIPGERDSRFQHRLQMVVSDVSRGVKVVLPQEARDYGIDPDDLEVAEAVRMSMSIPLFFRPIRLPFMGGQNYIVDGGMLSNFPVDLFDAKDDGNIPTFGFRLVNGGKLPSVQNSIHGPLSMARSLFATAFESNDERYIETHKFVRSILIDTLGISSTNFHLTDAEKDSLYESGRTAAKDFLSQLSWDEYKRLFCDDRPAPHRRDLLKAAMRMASPAEHDQIAVAPGAGRSK